MITDSSRSPAAVMASVPVRSVRLDGGFWGAVHDRTCRVTVPSMGEILCGSAGGEALENFRVAAGAVVGDHQGPPFSDGDLYKWLEAASVALATVDDPALAARVDDVIVAIAAAQRPDGYLHTPTLIKELAGEAAAFADRLDFETYNLGHLITAACVHHRVTGRTDLLDVGVRAAGYLRGVVATDPHRIAGSAICPSHYMGVVELYRVTGDPADLQLAIDLLALRDLVTEGSDDNQDRLPLREHRSVAGHAVRANYLYAGAADLALETGDVALRCQLEGLWGDVLRTRIHLTGGCGALYDGASPDGFPDQSQITRVHQAYGRPYQLPSTTAHNESCAAVGVVLWSWRMLLLTGLAVYADLIERVSYNGLLGSIGVQGDSYFYTNPLRQVRDLPFPLRRAGDTALDPVPAPPPSDERARQPWMSCFCCPPNIARTLVELPAMFYGVAVDQVWVHQFAPSRVTVGVGGVQVTLHQHTEYPAGGSIRLIVETDADVAMGLRVRVPGWASDATVTVNGDVVTARHDGYAVIERTWSDGDEVLLELPMSARKVVAHRLVEELANQVAVERGPLVYCLESVDLPEGATVERVLIPASASIQDAALPQPWADVPALRMAALLAPPGDAEALYAPLSTEAPSAVGVLLIPYAFWANRGPSEMSVWLNLTHQETP